MELFITTFDSFLEMENRLVKKKLQTQDDQELRKLFWTGHMWSAQTVNKKNTNHTLPALHVPQLISHIFQRARLQEF